MQVARRSGVPVYLLRPNVVSALGFPIDFPPELIVAKGARSAVDTEYRTISFISEEAVLRPRFEDIAIAMLAIDPIAARVLLERNRADLDPAYLLKRILTENLEEAATYVRFFDLVPGLPRVGRSLSSASIARKLHKNRSRGRLP